jgi:hypothetical protein
MARRPRYRSRMKIARTVAAAGIAKKLYDESKKPENRARMRAAVEKVKSRRRRS